jgi:hypothetical protein
MKIMTFKIILFDHELGIGSYLGVAKLADAPRGPHDPTSVPSAGDVLVGTPETRQRQPQVKPFPFYRQQLQHNKQKQMKLTLSLSTHQFKLLHLQLLPRFESEFENYEIKNLN